MAVCFPWLASVSSIAIRRTNDSDPSVEDSKEQLPTHAGRSRSDHHRILMTRLVAPNRFDIRSDSRFLSTKIHLPELRTEGDDD